VAKEKSESQGRSQLRKEFGLTFPFEQHGMVGYAKHYIAIELDLDRDILPQLEKAVKIDSILNEVMVKSQDMQVGKTMNEYDTRNIEKFPEELDTAEIIQMIRDSLKAKGLK